MKRSRHSFANAILAPLTSEKCSAPVAWPANILVRTVDTTRDATLIMDAELTVIYSNVAFHQHTGFPLSRLAGRRLPLRSKQLSASQRQLSPRWLRRLHQRGGWSGQLRIVQRDGHCSRVAVELFPVHIQQRGRCFALVLRDPAAATKAPTAPEHDATPCNDEHN